MENLKLTIPTLYADHHVIRVRQVLAALDGITNVVASSAFKQVSFEFDPAKHTSEKIIAALTSAGYAPGVEEIVERTPNATPDPAWSDQGIRVTTTNPIDLQLSGEFRKY
jgi:copper chaperone CopZ